MNTAASRRITRTVVALSLSAAIFSSTTTTASASSDVPTPRSSFASTDVSALVAEAHAAGTVPLAVVLDTGAPTPRNKGQFGQDKAAAARADAASSVADERAVRVRDKVLATIKGMPGKGLRALAGSPYISLKATEAEVKALAHAPGVKAIFRDEPFSQSSTSSYGASAQLPSWWHYNRIGLDWTTKSGWIGTGQTVVIIDSGVERNHPYLAGRVIYEACFSTNTDGSGGCPNGQRSQTNVTGSAAPCTYSWGCAHGTHVAHIAAGQYGVAPGARIIAIRASHKEWSTKTRGYEPMYSWSDVADALWFVYGPLPYTPASVNMSLGTDNGTTGYCDGAPAMKPMADGIAALSRDYRTATIIASGNANFYNGVSFPACISTAITVGNTTLQSATSSADAVYGNVSSGSNSGPQVDLLAPGTDICSAVPTYLDNDGTADGLACGYIGTSMAAPQVAGAYAVMRQSRPSSTVQDVFLALNRRGTTVTDSRNGLVRTRISVSNAVYYW